MPINWQRLAQMQEDLQLQVFLKRLHCKSHCARRRAKRGHGTSYTINPTELEILQTPHFNPSSAGWRPYPSRNIPLHQAFAQLQDPRVETPETLSAATRIRAFLHSNAPVTWDLCIKIFNDYDTVLFHGTLQRRVYLRWLPYSEIPALVAMRGELSCIGLTQPQDTGGMMMLMMHAGGNNLLPRIVITLRADLNWSALPRLAPLGTLVHEMLHAYFLVKCGFVGAQEFLAEDAYHGPVWTAAGRFLEGKTGLHIVDEWTDQVRE